MHPQKLSEEVLMLDQKWIAGKYTLLRYISAAEGRVWGQKYFSSVNRHCLYIMVKNELKFISFYRSLGVLLYTLVYGAMPFDGSNFKRLVKQITTGDYYEPKSPASASGLVRTMLTVSSDWWIYGPWIIRLFSWALAISITVARPNRKNWGTIQHRGQFLHSFYYLFYCSKCCIDDSSWI